MKKILTLVIAIAAFTSCIDGNDFVYNKHWDNEINALEKTDLPVTAIMQSAELWGDGGILYYTEPNGKGKEYDPLDKYRNEDGIAIYSGGTLEKYTFGHNTFRHYVSSVGIETYPSYWVEAVMTEVVNNYFTTELNYVGLNYHKFQLTPVSKTYHWKILAYDEKNIICETDFFGRKKDDDGTEYPYAIVHFKISSLTDHGWVKNAVSYEERLEAERKHLQDFYESVNTEYLEKQIASWITSGEQTIEWVDAYFKYYCPELYESTIKYILEKYK